MGHPIGSAVGLGSSGRWVGRTLGGGTQDMVEAGRGATAPALFLRAYCHAGGMRGGEQNDERL